MEIGKKIKEVAETKKVSVIELANMLGKSRQGIYDIYSGKVSVNLNLLELIAMALGEPMVNFLQEPAKPSIERQVMKEAIVEIVTEVMSKYYMHYSQLQDLSKEIHDKAKHGEGLVHLRVTREKDCVELQTVYQKLKKEVPENVLSGYADMLLDDLFYNRGPLWDRLSIKSSINKFFDDKGDGYILKILT